MAVFLPKMKTKNEEIRFAVFIFRTVWQHFLWQTFWGNVKHFKWNVGLARRSHMLKTYYAVTTEPTEREFWFLGVKR